MFIKQSNLTEYYFEDGYLILQGLKSEIIKKIANGLNNVHYIEIDSNYGLVNEYIVDHTRPVFVYENLKKVEIPVDMN